MAKTYYTLKFPGTGFSFPAPRWVMHGLGLVLVALMAGLSWRQVFPPAEPSLISAQQANHRLRIEVEEYNRHIFERPTVELTDPSGIAHVALYGDRCLITSLASPNGGPPSVRLLLDLSRPDLIHRDGESTRWPVLPAIIPEVLAAEHQVPPKNCLPPEKHQGKFTWDYGQRTDTCWVEVIRTYEDTCQHVQMFNSCTSSWDVDDKGRPKVRWTKCVH